MSFKKTDAVTRKKRKGLGLADLHAVLRFVRVAGRRLPPRLPDTLELCRAKPALPRLEERNGDERVQDVSIILCPFVKCRKEGDFQAQVELMFC